jgi:hypothetical protein
VVTAVAETGPERGSPDAITRRPADAAASRRRRRLAGVSLAAAAVVAAAVVTLGRQGGDGRGVVADLPSATSAPGELPPLYPGPGPGAASPAEAALGFAEGLGIADPVVVGEHPGVVEVRPGTGGPVTRVAVRARDGGWFVEAARSAGIDLDAPADGATASTPIRLRGRATAFEATIAVRVVPLGWQAFPAEPLTVVPASFMAGTDGEPGPFDVTVDVDPGRVGPVALVLNEPDASGRGEVLTATVVRLLVVPPGPRRLVEPGEAVAWLGPRLVVVRPDGSVGRQLYEDAKGPRGVPAASPDGRAVFTERWDYGPDGEPCGVSIVRITRPVERDPEVVAAGSSPAVSPGGERLAYVACDASVRVRDLTTGDEHVIGAVDAGGLPADPVGLAWSPDGRRLAVVVRYEDGVEIVVLDSGAGSLSDGEKLVDLGTEGVLAGWAPEGVAVAAGGAGAIAFDPTGGARRALFDGLPGTLRSARLDRDGTALVAVDADGVLWVARRGEAPRPLGPGYFSAGW